ncbi:aminoglycoside phosphotransferase family protein [Streptomyces sp. NPDC050523]|uniref:aminoglycoside phosphotransferase family protein n=1 Tax=Streptomyces sp. NPDC050523 TaxID=3365622 RepID=UPI0037B112E1
MKGHHNTNYVLRIGLPLAVVLGVMPFVRFKYRVPLETVEVVPRIWRSEVDVLAVVCRHLREVPRGFAVLGDRSLHRYRRGIVLSEQNPHGPVDENMLREFAAFFARTAKVPAKELPAPPRDWPADGESAKFLHWLIEFTERSVHLPNRERFGDLFDQVGIPVDAMTAFKERHLSLVSRRFVLLHTDVHRANVVVHRKGITVIDWELAIYGDPLHDLATHIVRMGYSSTERRQMVDLWEQAMQAAHLGPLTAGLHDDLDTYLDFEYAQSVFPDVMRAALSLPADAGDEHFRVAAERVRSAMDRACGPLELKSVKDVDQIMEALRKWHSMDAMSAEMTVE